LPAFGPQAVLDRSQLRRSRQREDNVAGVNTKADTTGIDAFAVGYLPIPFLDVFAKVGVISWDQDLHFSNIASSSDSGTDFAYGVGVGFAFGNAGLRAEYERFEIPDTDHVEHDFAQLHLDLPLTVRDISLRV